VTTRRGRAGQALIAVGGTCIGVLHLVHAARGDLVPWRHRLSEYANHTAGPLMTVAFLSLGAALLTLAPVVGRSRRLSVVSLRVAGVGLVASGIFRTGVTEAGATSDAVHAVVSSTATIAMIVAVVASRRWTFATITSALGATSPLTHGTVVGGLAQRLLWGTMLLWCVTSVPRQGHVSGSSARPRTMVP
jgi:hypothetical protein